MPIHGNAREARIDMMKVDRGGISRLCAPEMSNGSSQQAQHASYPLKRYESRGLAGECRKNVWMKRVARAEGIDRFRTCGIADKSVAVRVPAFAITVDDFRSAAIVDSVKQTPAKHLHRLVVLGRVQQRGFTRRNAFDLSHPI